MIWRGTYCAKKDDDPSGRQLLFSIATKLRTGVTQRMVKKFICEWSELQRKIIVLGVNIKIAQNSWYANPVVLLWYSRCV
jgi:hypothetical protein